MIDYTNKINSLYGNLFIFRDYKMQLIIGYMLTALIFGGIGFVIGSITIGGGGAIYGALIRSYYLEFTLKWK